MTRKELIETLIDEMFDYGETFIGTYEVQGNKALRLYRKLNAEVQKRFRNRVVCWNKETGMAWITR